MDLIDSHCHLTHGRLRPQFLAVLERARAVGVNRVICAAGDLIEARAALLLARKQEGVFSLAGVHPHDAKSAGADLAESLRGLLADPNCVALGEIGLDYHYNYSPPETQREVFAAQLDLAGELDCPVVVHTREAFDDTISALSASGVRGERVLLHSFTEGPDAARRALDLGATISFSGIVTFHAAEDVRQSARLVPADRILIETDGPFLSPEPVRRMKVNEPANVVHVLRLLAEVRGEPVESLAEATTRNAERFFRLPPVWE